MKKQRKKQQQKKAPQSSIKPSPVKTPDTPKAIDKKYSRMSRIAASVGSAWKFAVTVLAGIGTLSTLIVVYKNTFPTFEIRATPNASSPELPPFVVRNPSWLFDMYDWQIGCTVYGTVSKDPVTGMRSSAVFFGPENPFDSWASAPTTLPSDAFTNVSCNISNNIRGDEINGRPAVLTQGKLSMRARYKLKPFGWFILASREVSSREYRVGLGASGYNWVEGDLTKLP